MVFLTSTTESQTEERRAKLRSGIIVFYLKHPSDESQFIQCDELGAAFLELVCARREDIQLAEQVEQLQQTRVASSA
jgi:hypothetical protein